VARVVEWSGGDSALSTVIAQTRPRWVASRRSDQFPQPKWLLCKYTNLLIAAVLYEYTGNRLLLLCGFTFLGFAATWLHHHLQSEVWTNHHPTLSRGMRQMWDIICTCSSLLDDISFYRHHKGHVQFRNDSAETTVVEEVRSQVVGLCCQPLSGSRPPELTSSFPSKKAIMKPYYFCQ